MPEKYLTGKRNYKESKMQMLLYMFTVRNHKRPSLQRLDFMLNPNSSVIYDALTSSKCLNLHEPLFK